MVINCDEEYISLQSGPLSVPSTATQSFSQPVPVSGHNAPVSRPPGQPWGPLPPSQRPVHPVATDGSSAIPSGSLPPPQPVVRASELAGQPAGDIFSQTQYFGGPLSAGQAPPVGPPPMNKAGVPPQNLPPVSHGPQTAPNFGMAAPPEFHPLPLASQGTSLSAPMQAATSEMSVAGQFSGVPPPSQSQMNAVYNYTSQPRVMQPGQTPGPPTAGTPLSGPVSQPQSPRKLDPDQMPSPVSRSCLVCLCEV